MKAIDDDITTQIDSLEADFCYAPEYTISRYGKSKKFKAKDFSPASFMRLREKFGIQHNEYLVSWSTSKWEEHNFLGKNSRFVFTPDGKYMLKIITQEESKFLRSIMPQYVLHMTSVKNSFLMRIIAHHKVTIEAKQWWIIVAQNVLKSRHLSEIYDLTGIINGKATSNSLKDQTTSPSLAHDKKKLLVEDDYGFSFGPIMKDNHFFDKDKKIYLPSDVTTTLVANLAVDLKVFLLYYRCCFSNKNSFLLKT